MFDFLITLSIGILIGAVIVPLYPPLFRLAARIRGYIQDRAWIPESRDKE